MYQIYRQKLSVSPHFFKKTEIPQKFLLITATEQKEWRYTPKSAGRSKNSSNSENHIKKYQIVYNSTWFGCTNTSFADWSIFRRNGIEMCAGRFQIVTCFSRLMKPENILLTQLTSYHHATEGVSTCCHGHVLNVSDVRWTKTKHSVNYLYQCGIFGTTNTVQVGSRFGCTCLMLCSVTTCSTRSSHRTKQWSEVPNGELIDISTIPGTSVMTWSSWLLSIFRYLY